MAKKRRLRRSFRAARLFMAVILVAVFLWWNNTSLVVSHFDPAFPTLPPGFDGCRIVVLSDLHSAQFGRDNETLLETVAEQSPEYIFVVGDLIDQYRPQPEGYAASIAAGLSAIAPTYYVTGNHEWALGDVPALKKTLSDHGVTVLSNQAVTLERSGDTIVLAGIYLYQRDKINRRAELARMNVQDL